MKISLGTRLTLSVIAGLVPLLLSAHSTGGPDPRHTGGPGDDPLACASAGCHTGLPQGGPINAYGGSVTATFSQGSTYTPGSPVTISVKVSDPVNRTYGFQMSARRESDLANGQAGRFQPGSGQGVICDDGAQGIPRSTNGNCPTSNPLEFIEHFAASTGGWTFTWTPPAGFNERVHFYVAGNAVNNNGHEDAGDHVYTNEYVLEPQGACVTEAPIIDKVISPKGYGARTDFAPGTWVEITGHNFSTTTRQWLAADFTNGVAPIQNDRVKVKIGGQDAFVWYISPDQINAHTPDIDGEGPQGVVVTNCAQSSNTFTLTQHRQAPGLLAADVFFFNGKQYVIALFNGETTFVGDFAQFSSRPAKPGDLIVAYGVGFGATNPATPAGTVPTGAARLVQPLTITIGGTPADVIYAGISPFSVGLYQFVFTMPDVPDGDHIIQLKEGDEVVPPEAYITVRH